MPHISDEMLKALVYSLMVDEWPGYMVMNDVLWDMHGDIMEQYSDTEQEDVINRLSALIRRARVTITFDWDVD